MVLSKLLGTDKERREEERGGINDKRKGEKKQKLAMKKKPYLSFPETTLL